ncbi:hypothetical protein DCCM_0056 [Desulfocucumis palustris]|uniref:Uncharacterized protein n=1 Tax=Desulfocucumis palustris TaxID=1898651 RepID=A0A2L2X7D1_9FIRM|nr:hypothetical protein DCCM_0056 [Desulfocucumis palustris]
MPELTEPRSIVLPAVFLLYHKLVIISSGYMLIKRGLSNTGR